MVCVGNVNANQDFYSDYFELKPAPLGEFLLMNDVHYDCTGGPVADENLKKLESQPQNLVWTNH